MAHPTAGRDYPGSYADLLAWFHDDEACLDYLDWLRWREGWSCPRLRRAAGLAPRQRPLGSALPAGGSPR